MLVRNAGFTVVEPPLQTRSLSQFRKLIASVDGLIALGVPVDRHLTGITSAWIHNYVGAMAFRTDAEERIFVIEVGSVDLGGLGKLDSCRCPVVFPWQGTEQDQEEVANRLGRHMNGFLATLRDIVG